MKISVTDEFLLDVYNYLEKAGDAANFLFQPPTMQNFLPGPKNPIFRKYRHNKNRRKFNNLIYYLKRKGYIKAKNLKNKKALILTKVGVDKALKASFKLEKAQKRRDGKWIMLIFDMPVRYKKSRDLMRSLLRNLGYKMFQQSVWITPYDISEKTEKLLQMYSLDRYVKIFLIEGM